MAVVVPIGKEPNEKALRKPQNVFSSRQPVTVRAEFNIKMSDRLRQLVAIMAVGAQVVVVVAVEFAMAVAIKIVN